MIYLIILLLGSITINIYTMNDKSEKQKKPEKKSLTQSLASLPIMIFTSSDSDSASKSSHESPSSNKTNRSRSSSPDRHPSQLSNQKLFEPTTGSSDKSSKITPRKLSRKSHSDSPKNRQKSFIELALLDAVEEGDTNKLKQILYPNINCVDAQGKTLLIKSIDQGNIDMVKILLQRNDIDVNKADIYGNTPLHRAAFGGYENIITILLHDPRVNAFVQNKYKSFARELTHTTEYRLKLFARATLDNHVEEEVFAVHSNKTTIGQAIENIKKGVERDHTDQKDYQPLPEETKLPHYADDEFIRQMLAYRLSLVSMLQKNDDKVEPDIATYI